MWRNSTEGWGTLSKTLHWLVAALIVVQVPLGAIADDMKLSPLKLDLFVWHKSVGMLVLALVLVRLGWRLGQPVPRPADVSPLLRRLATLTHVLLYVLLLVIPLSGWVVNSAAGIPVKLFWLVPLPALTSPDDGLKESAAEVHEIAIGLLLAVLTLHVAAALWHQFVRRDGILRRMWFGG